MSQATKRDETRQKASSANSVIETLQLDVANLDSRLDIPRLSAGATD